MGHLASVTHEDILTGEFAPNDWILRTAASRLAAAMGYCDVDGCDHDATSCVDVAVESAGDERRHL